MTPTAARSSVLAIVLAGGQGSRMDVLTERRAKPTLPFGGVHSLLDIAMSNVTNSGLTEAWVVVQYHASSFDPVLAHGRPWDLDRNVGGLRVIPPQQGLGEDEGGMATGNADALYRIRSLIQAHGADHVLVLSADHVYRLDHREVLAHHLDAGAECTVVTTTIGRSEAGHHTLVDVRDGRVTGVHHKPDEPAHETVASEVFLYDTAVLLEALDELHARLSGDAADGDTGLGDFSEHLLPELVGRGKVVGYELPGYWRDLGRPSAYLRAHLDLIDDRLDILDSPSWPIRTATPQGTAGRVVKGAVVEESLIGDGCRVAGTVKRCVLGPGVVVEAGAVVHDSVLMAGVQVRAGAHVGWSIVDDRARVMPEASVGRVQAPRGERLLSEQVTLVGMDALVQTGARVAPGAHVAPGGVVRVG